MLIAQSRAGLQPPEFTQFFVRAPSSYFWVIRVVTLRTIARGYDPTQPGTLSHHPLLAILANFALHARLRRGAGSISGKIAF